MRRWPLRRLALVVLLAPLVAAACIFNRLNVAELPRTPRAAYAVPVPVKAHLTDGGVVVYPSGVRVGPDSLTGAGKRYDLTRRDSAWVLSVPLADVVALESFSNEVNAAATTIGSIFGTAAVLVGTAALAVAIFGSCPTVYADSGAGLALQAESFSMSIAPLYEARDVDRLAVRTDEQGRFVIEIRNEALETHYINQLRVLAIDHAPHEVVVPDAWGRPLAAAGITPASGVRDARGDDHSALVAAADQRPFRTHAALLAAAADTGALDDRLEFAVARPAAESAAVVLRMRNSLLNTVLLYDELLAARGAQALEWLGGDLSRIGEAAQLGQWYARRMGMRVSVLEGGTWRFVGRVPDVGPIAWKDIAVVVPVPRDGDSLRVRLSFVADDWRIDRIQVATAIRRPAIRLIEADSILDADRRASPAAMAAVHAADGRYLQTAPGDRFLVHWNAGPAAGTRTLLLASQGYYVEWMRRDWLAGDGSEARGAPDDALLRRALTSWRRRQRALERDFHNSRIPVR